MVNIQNLIEIVRTYLPESNEVIDVTPQTRFILDLGLNSLTVLRIAMDLDKKLNFDVIRASREADFTKIESIEHLFDLIEVYQKTKIKNDVILLD